MSMSMSKRDICQNLGANLNQLTSKISYQEKQRLTRVYVDLHEKLSTKEMWLSLKQDQNAKFKKGN